MSRMMTPKCVVQVGVHGHRYGATFVANDEVALFGQSIRNGQLSWKRIGVAKWDPHHGLYALPGGSFEFEAVAPLEGCLRSLRQQ